MTISLPLNEMSVEEKLELMELLWQDLDRSSTQIKPPAWHREVLTSREQAISRGDEVFEEWEIAREKIEKEIR